ncbi:peptidyl-prolyl cis-trans isomerase-like, partial [Bidens hawaiensis]|uniref:peptidyl-prolyl cis-trans isomerase-like n=1 Tax=Bidens hawaiensis TaxID=980011 RepID=UPI0040499CC8
LDEKLRNPRVFLDISINRSPPQRLVIELFADVLPKTAENFRALCVGDKRNGTTTGKPLHYKGCVFFHIIKGFFAQVCTGGESIYGNTFPDENFKLDHSGPGILSMANDSPNSNGSRFYISFSRQLFLDGCHVVFGKVIEGLETVQNIEKLGTTSGRPIGPVEITDCGEIPRDEKSAIVSAILQGQKEAMEALVERFLDRDSDSSSSTDETRRKNKRKAISSERKSKRYSQSSPCLGVNISDKLESRLGLRMASPRRSLSPSPHEHSE